MTFIICTLMAGAMTACAPSQQQAQSMWNTLDGGPPLIIAHRGASGYLPEHTLEGYALAIDQGADVVEPDLVFTKDGVLVIRHDRYLSTTTDIADHPEFADRKRPDAYFEQSEGEIRDDWWVEDFTLAEIKTLRARQPREGRSTLWDGLYEVPTFKEMLALVTEKSKAAGRPVGVYPETKHPGFFESIGHDFEAPLLAALKSFDAGPVFIQSFEPEILKRLKGKTTAKLVQLVYEVTPGAGPNIPYKEIADYADGVGISKKLVWGGMWSTHDGLSGTHGLNLFVHAWTVRDDDPDLSLPEPVSSFGCACSSGDHVAPVRREICFLFNRFVDGIFTDFPDTAYSVRQLWEYNPVYKE